MSNGHAQAFASTGPARALLEEDITSSKENTFAPVIPESTAKLAQELSHLLAQLEPFKVIMHPELRYEMDTLKDKANKLCANSSKP